MADGSFSQTPASTPVKPGDSSCCVGLCHADALGAELNVQGCSRFSHWKTRCKNAMGEFIPTCLPFTSTLKKPPAPNNMTEGDVLHLHT